MGKRARSAEKEKQRKLRALDESLPTNWDGLDDSDLEADMDNVENQPRRFNVDDPESEGLPIIVNGRVQRVIRETPQPEAMSHSESEDSSHEEDGDEASVEEKPAEELTETQVREMVATYAELINAEPEEHLSKMRELQDLVTATRKSRTRQLLVLSLTTLYKTLLPGYRIRPLTEAQRKEKASKEVRELRDFEQRLLNLYRKFVELLTGLSKQGRGDSPQPKKQAVAAAALEAACELLEAAPHFNFRHELIQIVVGRLASQRIDSTFSRALECLGSMFEHDDEGHVTLDVVQQIARMIRTRRYKVDSRVVAALVGMQLLSDMPAVNDVEGESLPKLRKKDRIPLTKKQRKQRKEQKEIDEEMRKAETAVSAEMRGRLQNQVLQLVFRLYLEILKAESKHLTPAALEGLAAYAHLINTELFGDLLEVLREVLSKSRTTRQILLCIVTAQALLRGQSRKGNAPIDLSFFATQLYAILPRVCLDPHIEQRHRSLASSHQGRLASETDMLVRALEQLFGRAGPAASRARTLAFVRRLSLLAPHCPPRTCLVLLRVVAKLMDRFPHVRALLTTQDRVMRGSYDAETDNPDHANAEVASTWEIAILRQHYAPEVRKAASQL